MTTKLSKQDIRYLLIADARLNDPMNRFRLFPESKWFEERLLIGTQAVTNIKRRLIKKGLLEETKHGEIILSELANQFITERQTQGKHYPVEIPTPGQVSAGDKSSGELITYTSDINDFLSDTISILDIEYVDKIVVAYEVVGNSMEEEEIFPGNYVIVEVNPDKARQTNRIIVTKYWHLDDSDNDPPKGPTLKAYKGEGKDPSGRNCHVLGWIGKNEKNNPHTIYARNIEPIGIVIGVYTPYPKSTKSKVK